MSVEGRAKLAQVFDSAVYKTWAALSPVDAGKVADEFAGNRRPSASSKFAAGLIGLCRLNPPSITPPPPPASELVAFVRDASHMHAGDMRGIALSGCPNPKMLLQFADPANDVANRQRVPAWRQAWLNIGVGVEGWWRVNHLVDNRPTVPGITGWWPNAETDQEVSRLPVIYQQPGVQGVVTLGKKPGLPVQGPVMIECFRETPASDTTITNCVRWWHQTGVPTDQLVVMLQGYGDVAHGNAPWGPPVQQAQEAISLGVRRLALYPADGFAPADIVAIGALLR